MPGEQIPPNTTADDIATAPAGALRVGRGAFPAFLTGFNTPPINHLAIGYAQSPGARQHSTWCQTKRNLFIPGAIGSGAPVPLGVFAALIVKFLSTLTLSDCRVYVADVTRGVFFALLTWSVFSY